MSQKNLKIAGIYIVLMFVNINVKKVRTCYNVKFVAVKCNVVNAVL